MFSRDFTFKGYDGNIHKETWWFNLSEAELAELQLGSVGGLDGMIKRMLRENKPDAVIETIKKIILKAVGERSADGCRFIKKQLPGMPWGEVGADFYESPAYSQLFTEIVSDADNFINFLLGAMPDEMAKAARKLQEEEKMKEKTEAATAEVFDPTANVAVFTSAEAVGAE